MICPVCRTDYYPPATCALCVERLEHAETRRLLAYVEAMEKAIDLYVSHCPCERVGCKACMLRATAEAARIAAGRSKP